MVSGLKWPACSLSQSKFKSVANLWCQCWSDLHAVCLNPSLNPLQTYGVSVEVTCMQSVPIQVLQTYGVSVEVTCMQSVPIQV